MSVVDLDDEREIERIVVGDYPEGIDIRVNARRVYVANWFSNSISVIDADSLEMVDEFAAGDGSRAFGDFILE